MSRPFFTRDRISDFDLFDRHADTVIGQIKARMRTGYSIDFQVCPFLLHQNIKFSLCPRI